MNTSRDLIIKTARSWIGTPYHHQANLKQVGCDCLGLILGVYSELNTALKIDLPNYTPDWAETHNNDLMLNGMKDHLNQIEISQKQKGDVLLFRFRENMAAKHAAILSTENKMIHALEGANVSEVYLNKWWHRRIAATFCFPGV